jgi:hypothetical protein
MSYMDDQSTSLPSSKFRRVYPGLTTTTTVTVSGHVIGTWIPAVHVPVSTMTDGRTLDEIRPGQPDSFHRFSPAPKPAGRKR